jgi:serine/threonine protein kinase
VVLASEILKSLAMHGTTVGIVLIMVNIAVIGLAILVLIQRWKSERELEKWRRKLSDDEIKKISNLMNGITASDNGVSSHPADEAVIMMLKQYTIKPADVKILQRVGSGAYGEVFKGTCLGSAVAIKTMLDVSDQNVLNFRAEIILTAALRHPNIIQFVGACWDRELIALVLEVSSMLTHVSSNRFA